MKKRVLIVDDSAFVRQTLKEILSDFDDINVTATAVNGVDAIEKTLKYNPDIILLDLEMPLLDGFGFMRWLMMEKPTPVIIVSSHSNRENVFRALQAGAVDFVAKPTRKASTTLLRLRDDLIAKIRVLDRKSLKTSTKAPEPAPEIKDLSYSKQYDVIAIGASTGGPQAIETVLRMLPPLGLSVLVSLHMPAGFTRAYAERLDRVLPWKIKEAESGENLNPDTVYICPGGYHLAVKRTSNGVVTEIKNASEKDRYVPSIDMLMSSVGEVFKKRAIGVILTGMGSDGKTGVEVLFRAGGYTIVESEDTAVVYGMPRVIAQAGLAKKSLPLHRIASEIVMLACGKEKNGKLNQ